MKNKQNHEINEDKLHLENEEVSKSHYHGEHHIYDNGLHDDVIEEDFSIKHSFKYSKTNLIYKITATGVFLALAIIGTVIDGLGLEEIALLIPPINGVFVTLRIFDILFICISLSVVGPLFSSFICLVVPFVHYGMHPHGSAITPVVDALGYVIITWILWLLFYAIFKNSFFHKEVETKKDKFKKYMPFPAFVIIAAITLTATYILNQYISSLGAHDHHEHEHGIEHEEIDLQWESLNKAIVANIFIVFGLNIIRFSIIYLLFVSIESRIKVINHRYR